MTIASAFNDIAVAQGGTANKSGTIAGAIDALSDALAGSDVKSPQTIEGAVRMMGEHISSGGGIVLADWYCAFRNSTGDTLYYSAYYGDTYLLDGVYPEDEDLTFKAGETFVFYLQSETELTFTPDVGEAITISGVYDEPTETWLYTFETAADMEPIEYFTITKNV